MGLPDDRPVAPTPWTQEYVDHRERAFRSAAADARVLNAFASPAPLPGGYGQGLDERCIEFPWVLANLPPGPARLMDAGSSLNHDFLLEHPLLASKRVHIVTLAPEPYCAWTRGISYVFEDLRRLPFADALYDIVVSVSTIEHIGCDNTFYTGLSASAEQRLDDFVLAAAELGRVLRPGGLLLLTVPYGRYQFQETFQQFDRSRLSRAEAALGPMAVVEESFYRYSREGWQLARDEECADCEYAAWVSELMRTRRWPDPLQVEPDGAAAARAVACVKFVKAGHTPLSSTNGRAVTVVTQPDLQVTTKSNMFPHVPVPARCPSPISGQVLGMAVADSPCDAKAERMDGRRGGGKSHDARTETRVSRHGSGSRFVRGGRRGPDLFPRR